MHHEESGEIKVEGALVDVLRTAEENYARRARIAYCFLVAAFIVLGTVLFIL